MQIPEESSITNNKTNFYFIIMLLQQFTTTFHPLHGHPQALKINKNCNYNYTSSHFSQVWNVPKNGM